MNKYDLIVGIDPDIDKSGFVSYDFESSEYQFEVLTLKQILKRLDEYKISEKRLLFLVEAGWLNKKSNYHAAKNKVVGERIAKNVGSNHQRGRDLVEIIEYVGFEVRLLQPISKKWNEKILKSLGFSIKNQEMIDAFKMVYLFLN